MRRLYQTLLAAVLAVNLPAAQTDAQAETATATMQARLLLALLSASPATAAERVPVLDAMLVRLEVASEQREATAEVRDLRQRIAERRYGAARDAAFADRALRWKAPRSVAGEAQWRAWLVRLSDCLADAETSPLLGAWLQHLQDERAAFEPPDPALAAAAERVTRKHAASFASTRDDALALAGLASRLGVDVQPLISCLTDAASRSSIPAYTTLLELMALHPPATAVRCPDSMPRLEWASPIASGITSVTLLAPDGSHDTRCSAAGFARLGVVLPGVVLRIVLADGGTVVVAAAAHVVRVPPPAAGATVIVDDQGGIWRYTPLKAARAREIANTIGDRTSARFLADRTDPLRLAAGEADAFRKVVAAAEIHWPDRGRAEWIEASPAMRRVLGLGPGEFLLRSHADANAAAVAWLPVELRRDGVSR